MNETYINIPTIFEIEIREFGWIQNVYLEVDGLRLPAEWVGYVWHSRKCRYSIFRVCYTFKDISQNKKATFYYSVGNVEHVCNPLIFNVYPLYD